MKRTFTRIVNNGPFGYGFDFPPRAGYTQYGLQGGMISWNGPYYADPRCIPVSARGPFPISDYAPYDDYGFDIPSGNIVFGGYGGNYPVQGVTCVPVKIVGICPPKVVSPVKPVAPLTPITKGCPPVSKNPGPEKPEGESNATDKGVSPVPVKPETINPVTEGPTDTNIVSPAPTTGGSPIDAVPAALAPTVAEVPSPDETPFFRGRSTQYDFLKHGSQAYDVTPQHLQDQGMKVVVYKHGSSFSHEKLQSVKALVEETVRVHESYFGKFVARDVPRELGIHMFDSTHEYFQLLNVYQPGISSNVSGLCNAGDGLIWVSPATSQFKERLGSLSHELGHFLLHCATGGVLERVYDAKTGGAVAALHDGYAEFLSGKVNGIGEAGYSQIASRVEGYFERHHDPSVKVLDEMGSNLAQGRCPLVGCNAVQYDAGHLLVKFFMEKHPGVLQTMFKQAARLGAESQHMSQWEIQEEIKKILKGIDKYSMSEVASWVREQASSHDTFRRTPDMSFPYDDDSYDDDYLFPHISRRKKPVFSPYDQELEPAHEDDIYYPSSYGRKPIEITFGSVDCGRSPWGDSESPRWGSTRVVPVRGRRVRRDISEDQDVQKDDAQVAAAEAKLPNAPENVTEPTVGSSSEKASAVTTSGDLPRAVQTERAAEDVPATAATTENNAIGEQASVEPKVAETAGSVENTKVVSEISDEVLANNSTRESFADAKKQTPVELKAVATTGSVENTKVVSDEVPANSNTRKSFADVEEQFTVTTTVSSKLLERCNIKLEVHSTTPLSDKAAARFKKAIAKTLKAYQEEFGELPHSDTVRKVNIYLFDNSIELKNALRDIGEPNCDTAAGINWSSLGKIYVYKSGKVKVENLHHEFTHQLMHFSTGNAFDNAPGMEILREGVADYIQHRVVSNKKGVTIEFSTVIDKVRKVFNENPALQNAKSLEEIHAIIKQHAGEPEYDGLQYSLGKTLVYYLQKFHPEVLKGVFAAGHEKSARGEFFDKLSSIVNDIPSTFSEWLSENTVDKHISKHEMLTVSEADSLGYCDTIANSKVVRANVYAANLDDSNHVHVGKLSPVAHFVHSGAIRAYNPLSGDGIILGNEFSYIKLVSTADGQKYVYCDVEGKEFTTELSYSTVDQIAKILGKYDQGFAAVRGEMVNLGAAFSGLRDELDPVARSKVLEAINNLKALLGYAARNVRSEELQHLMNTDFVQRDPSMDNITLAVRNLRAAYSKYVSAETQTLLHDPEHSAFEHAMMLSRILKSIVYIDPEAMIGINGATFDPEVTRTQDKILHIEGLGKGDSSGASVMLDGKKLGELPSNAEGFVKYTDGAGRENSNFITMDSLKAVHTSYSGTPLIIVTKDAQGNKVANFWSSTKSGTLSDQEIEVEVNQFLDLAAKGVKARDSFPVSKGVKIAIYDKDPITDDETPVIVQGAKLDDRGTERESDDLYSAKLKVGDYVLVQKMFSLQFYMTEERTDEHGNKIEKSDFFIRDVAADRVIQFPESITHLKLVRTEKGTVRLVPCTKDGDINPDGMPSNMEQYSYIDPLFVYDRKSSEWVATNSKFSLVDFSKYSSGTLFKMSYDRNDPAIRRDEDGNVLRVNDQPYCVSVIIEAPNGETIGRLASATAFFQDKVFLAMDQSYSQSDFVASRYEQEAEVLDTSAPDVKRVLLSGENDLGTDRGFSNYYSQYQRTEEDNSVLRTEIQQLSTGAQPQAAAYSEDEPIKGVTSQRSVSQVHEASASEQNVLTHTCIFMAATSDLSNGKPCFSFNILDRSTGTHMQFPNEITHVKVVTQAGQKLLVPCTADGDEAPKGMPSSEKVYINPLLVHTSVSKSKTESGDRTQLALLNLDPYADGTLFSVKVGGQLSYSALGHEDRVGDHVRVPHLYDENGAEVAMLSTYGMRISSTVVIEETARVQGSTPTEEHNVASDDSTVDTTHLVSHNTWADADDYAYHGQPLTSERSHRGKRALEDALSSVDDGADSEHEHNVSGQHDGYTDHQYGYSDNGVYTL